MHSYAMAASGQSRWPQLAVAANNGILLLAKTDSLGQWHGKICGLSLIEKKQRHLQQRKY